MRLSCLAILLLSFGLVGFDAFGIGSAPGQTPVPQAQAQPPATTVPAQGSGNWAPAAGMGAFPMADFHTAADQYYRGAVSHASTKEMELDRQSRELARQYGKTESRDEREKLRDKLNDVLK